MNTDTFPWREMLWLIVRCSICTVILITGFVTMYQSLMATTENPMLLYPLLYWIDSLMEVETYKESLLWGSRSFVFVVGVVLVVGAVGTSLLFLGYEDESEENEYWDSWPR